MTHEQLLKAYQFTRAGSCSCGGTRNEIYKRDNYQLYYRKRRHTFKIKKKNDTVTPIQSLNNLKTILQQLFPDEMVKENIQPEVQAIS